MVYCFDCSRGGRKQHTKSHSDLFSHSWKCNFMITCSSLSNLYREKHTMILERLMSTSSDSYSFPFVFALPFMTRIGALVNPGGRSAHFLANISENYLPKCKLQRSVSKTQWCLIYMKSQHSLCHRIDVSLHVNAVPPCLRSSLLLTQRSQASFFFLEIAEMCLLKENSQHKKKLRSKSPNVVTENNLVQSKFFLLWKCRVSLP